MRHFTRDHSRGELSAVEQRITLAPAICKRLEPSAPAVSRPPGRPLGAVTTAWR
jgi:hypothetical protein